MILSNFGGNRVAKVADVVIIGGGIVGVSIAHCLGLKKPKGFRAVLLEKEALCSGSTGKSVGVIYLQHSTRAEIELTKMSFTMRKASKTMVKK